MNDVALVPQILTQMVGRAVDVPQISADRRTVALSRKSPNKLSTDHIQCLSSDSGRSSAAGHDPGGVRASSSASDDPLMCSCPLQCCRPLRESWKVPVVLAMAQGECARGGLSHRVQG